MSNLGHAVQEIKEREVDKALVFLNEACAELDGLANQLYARLERVRLPAVPTAVTVNQPEVSEMISPMTAIIKIRTKEINDSSRLLRSILSDLDL